MVNFSPSERKSLKNFKKSIDKTGLWCYNIDIEKGKENRSMMYEIYEDWYEAYLEVKEASNEEEM